MNARILIVDDEAGVAATLKDRLQKQGYAVSIARDGNAGMEMALEGLFDLVILDLILRGQDGLSICRNLRRLGSKTPILVLTSRRETKDKVTGLQAGADDYLTKPFEMAELLARTDALLRRAGPGTVLCFVPYKFGDLQVDVRSAEVTRGGKPVTLSAMEFRLLKYFVENRGATISRDELWRKVWAYSHRPRSRTVDAHVAFLRRKIEPDPQNPQFILTILGMGYKFVGESAELDA